MITGPFLPDNIQTQTSPYWISSSSLIALNSTHFVIVCYKGGLYGRSINSAILSWPKMTSSKLPSFNTYSYDRCVAAIGFGKVTQMKSIYTACFNLYPMYLLELLSYDIAERSMDEEWRVIASWSVNPADAVGKHFEKL